MTNNSTAYDEGKVTRVQLDMAPKSMSRLIALKADLEASSYAEVVRRAVSVFDDVLARKAKGQEILVRDPASGVIVPYQVMAER